MGSGLVPEPARDGGQRQWVRQTSRGAPQGKNDGYWTGRRHLEKTVAPCPIARLRAARSVLMDRRMMTIDGKQLAAVKGGRSDGAVICTPETWQCNGGSMAGFFAQRDAEAHSTTVPGS